MHTLVEQLRLCDLRSELLLYISQHVLLGLLERVNHALQSFDDPILLLDGFLADSQVLLQLEVLIRYPLQLQS